MNEVKKRNLSKDLFQLLKIISCSLLRVFYISLRIIYISTALNLACIKVRNLIISISKKKQQHEELVISIFFPHK